MIATVLNPYALIPGVPGKCSFNVSAMSIFSLAPVNLLSFPLTRWRHLQTGVCADSQPQWEGDCKESTLVGM